ncbi:hypothetical protein B0O80DRAFT_83300 [Mortierella sp. GBAus27b]|nr:hypothetical protein B0O80DRAFT_83300 [Mortierella sp. GBAus27b]
MRSNLIPSSLVLFLLSFPSLSSIPGTHAALLDQCAVSITALIIDPRINACIPFEPLAQLANGTDLTPKFVNDTTTTFCELPFCSPQTVSLIENTLNQNCVNSTEDQDDNNWFFGFASLYVPFKQGMCQRVGLASATAPPPPLAPGEARNGTFCIAILTESLQAYLKDHPPTVNYTAPTTTTAATTATSPFPTLSLPSSAPSAVPKPNKKPKGEPEGWAILGNTTRLREYIQGMPNDTLCTPCNKAMINPLNRFVAARQLSLDTAIVAWVRTLQSEVEKKCGEAFVDGIGPPWPETTGLANNPGLTLKPRSGVVAVVGLSIATTVVSMTIGSLSLSVGWLPFRQ